MITDPEIALLLAEAKVITNPRAKSREQRKSVQAAYSVASAAGSSRFELYTRQSLIDPENYSCGLIYKHPSGSDITLARYNGSNHEHRNPLEGGELIRFKCHIHRATQRYIELGDKAEKFAETTDRYTDLEGAVRCLLVDWNITGFHTIHPEQTDNGAQLPLL